MIRALVLVLLVGCVTPRVATAQSAPASRWADALSLDEFRADLARTAQRVRSAVTAAEALALADAIPNRWRVDVGDRQPLDLSTRWLTMALQGAPANATAWPETREALAGRLERMRDEIVSSVAASNDGGTRVRARTSVQTILSREEFQQGAVSRWREDVRDRVTQWVEALLTRLGITGRTGRQTVNVLSWMIGLAALGGLGVWLARTMTARPRHLLMLASKTMPRPRAHDLAVRALAHAREGNIREAVRIAYHAALVRFEEQGVWRMDDARTPREYVRMLAASDARRGSLLEITRRFEQIWYGNRAADEHDAESVASQLEILGCLRPGERAI